jgi:N-acetylmuramoyl-L-alanine amidase
MGPALALTGLLPLYACEGTLRVALDIGHDLSRSGAASATGKSEYAFNARLAQEALSALNTLPDLDVFLIEDRGRRISLGERRARARAGQADVLISLHHDSAQERFLSSRVEDGKVLYSTDLFEGFSVFYSEKNARSERALEMASALGSALRYYRFVPTDHHAMDVDGERRDLVVPEYGVYRFDDLAVLKADMPAVLLEAGVIVNPQEEWRLEQPIYRQQMVAALALSLQRMRCPLLADDV